MRSNKIIFVFSLLAFCSFCQFSSFVPSYLVSIPSDFITSVPATQPIDSYISFKTPPTFKSVFGVDSTQEQSTKIQKSVCVFPFVLLDSKCQCPRFLNFAFGKCVGATPSDYNTTPIPNNNIGAGAQSNPSQSVQQNEQANSATSNDALPQSNSGAVDNTVISDRAVNTNTGSTTGNYNPNNGNNNNNNNNNNGSGPLIQCPLLRINAKRTGKIQDLAFISRTYDGTNNNVDFPDWGSAGSLLQRRCDAYYSDGVSDPITHLPSPRVISNTVGSIGTPIPTNRLNVTIAFTIFGQFVDHDLDLTPSQSGNDAQFLNITIPKNDPFFKNQSYIAFTRSQAVDHDEQARGHKNIITSWIDGSQIYGSGNQTNCALRSFRNGKLKVSKKNGQDFLPLFNNFFRAGDVRAIQNSILASYHTIFVREHNRICDQVLAKNPKYNDETVFQIARNYVIGLLQKIVMKDFVSILLGDKYNQIIGNYKGYKDNVNPNIPTQFSTASFRLGHPLLMNKIPSVDHLGSTSSTFNLNQLFFNQDLLTQGQFVTNIIRGAGSTLTKQRTSQIIDDVRNLLVLDPAHRQIKLDLYSLNLQRGRDHGLPTYNEARAAFGLKKIKTFQQFLPTNQISVAKKLKTVYGTPDNIELFVGIISQKPVANGILGELGVQIVGQTFRNLRDGDRFWYEKAFPSSIVSEIEKTQLGDIVRRNSQKNNNINSDLFRIKNYK